MSHAEGEGQYFIPHHVVQKMEGNQLNLRVYSMPRPNIILVFP